MDRISPSEGGDAGSIPAEGTKQRLKRGSSRSSLSESDLETRNPAMGGRLLVGTQ